VTTILISNRKGGSGKSTTATNLACELAKTSSVLLIDFDTQGHSSIGVNGYLVEDSGAHSIFFGNTLSQSFRPTLSEKLTLSPALEFFDVFEYSELSGVLKNRFKKERLSEFFDYCIIDTAPTYDTLLKNSLEVANAVVIPMIPHHLGVVGVGQMFRAIYQMSLSMNKKAPFVGILPVMYNSHIVEHKESILKIKDKFGSDKIFTPIGIDINLAKQFELKTPAVLSNSRMRGAIDYMRFTQELKEKLIK
jgi:chromosome partitioning protein